MYTLRTIKKEQGQQNVNLGNSYSVADRDLNSEEFISIYNNIYPEKDKYTKENINADIYAIITSNEFGARHFLYKGDFNYIVTETGSTFSNLTFK